MMISKIMRERSKHFLSPFSFLLHTKISVRSSRIFLMINAKVKVHFWPTIFFARKPHSGNYWDIFSYFCNFWIVKNWQKIAQTTPTKFLLAMPWKYLLNACLLSNVFEDTFDCFWLSKPGNREAFQVEKTFFCRNLSYEE